MTSSVGASAAAAADAAPGAPASGSAAATAKKPAAPSDLQACRNHAPMDAIRDRLQWILFMSARHSNQSDILSPLRPQPPSTHGDGVSFRPDRAFPPMSVPATESIVRTEGL